VHAVNGTCIQNWRSVLGLVSVQLKYLFVCLYGVWNEFYFCNILLQVNQSVVLGSIQILGSKFKIWSVWEKPEVLVSIAFDVI